MLRTDSSPYDPGINKGMHYTLVVAALVVGIVVGGLFGVAFKNRQTDEIRFSRDLAAVASSTVTLELVEQGQRARIQKVQENLLAMNARDAFVKLPAMKRLPLKTPQLMTALGRAQAYAQRHKLVETAGQLGTIRQKIETQP